MAKEKIVTEKEVVESILNDPSERLIHNDLSINPKLKKFLEKQGYKLRLVVNDSTRGIPVEGAPGFGNMKLVKIKEAK